MNRPQFTAPMDSSNFIAPENVILRNAIEIENMKRTINELRRKYTGTFYGGKKRSNRRTRRIHNKRTRKGSRIHKKMH